MLALYLAVMIIALYYVLKLLGPEMAQPSSPEVAADSASRGIVKANRSNKGIEKFENLLIEKNKNIGLLQKELNIFYTQVRDFDKIKTVLEEEIHRLRVQNRIFRSELGLPAAQTKQNSIT